METNAETLADRLHRGYLHAMARASGAADAVSAVCADHVNVKRDVERAVNGPFDADGMRARGMALARLDASNAAMSAVNAAHERAVAARARAWLAYEAERDRGSAVE
jgi:regulator of sirC expression with transglutaminase-like and TPR domain